MRKIKPKLRYFDYASTTPVDSRVLRKMLPYFSQKFGNPANLYRLGRETDSVVKMATADVAGILNCRPDEFFFTGSATESDNLAILGVARANKEKGDHIVLSELEHKGILAMIPNLEKEGFRISLLPVSHDGLIKMDELKKLLTPQTILVSVTTADSETGTVQSVADIAGIIKDFRQKNNNSLPYFHTDASQAAGYTDLNTEKLGVDLMTLSAHKIYGPKGIAGLFVRRGTNIRPIIFGGGQGGKLHSGTQNVPGIVGFAEALKLTQSEKNSEVSRIKKLRDLLENGILKSIPKVVLNGHPKNRLPNFLNVSILDVEGEAMLLSLDELGIMVGTGSACNSQSLSPSTVLVALGNPYEFVHGSLRFSLGHQNTEQDVKFVLKHLPKIVERLRQISPLDLSSNQKSDMSVPQAFVGGQTPHFLKNKKSKK
jgi:cysteine desulfurase